MLSKTLSCSTGSGRLSADTQAQGVWRSSYDHAAYGVCIVKAPKKANAKKCSPPISVAAQRSKEGVKLTGKMNHTIRRARNVSSFVGFDSLSHTSQGCHNSASAVESISVCVVSCGTLSIRLSSEVSVGGRTCLSLIKCWRWRSAKTWPSKVWEQVTKESSAMMNLNSNRPRALPSTSRDVQHLAT